MLTNLVLIAVHASQSTNVREDVLQSIGKLESVNVAQAELDIGIHDEFCKAKDFTAQMERISEARLFALLCRQSPGNMMSYRKKSNTIRAYLTGFRFML